MFQKTRTHIKQHSSNHLVFYTPWRIHEIREPLAEKRFNIFRSESHKHTVSPPFNLIILKPRESCRVLQVVLKD